MGKPRLIYFRPPLNGIPPFIQEFAFLNRERGLEYFFDLIIIDYPCDFGEAVRKHEADLAGLFFHSEFQSPPQVTNVRQSDIPKFGLLGVDSFSPARYQPLHFFESVGVDAIFTMDSSFGGIHCQGFAPKLFYWPWFIDTTIFKDYGLPKEHQFLLSGHSKQTYPWRMEIFPIIESTFPSHRLQYAGGNPKPVFGVEYARVLNASTFVPTCGGFTQVIVMKHLEIPASRACLVTERTDALEQMGFSHRENCLFLDASNFESEIRSLLTTPGKIHEITDCGWRMISEKHTRSNRPQIREWYELWKSSKGKAKVIQPSLFGSLENACASGASSYFVSTARHLARVQQIDNAIRKGDGATAEKGARWLLENYLIYSADFLIRLAIAQLLQGKNKEAGLTLLRSIEKQVSFECSRPDPAEVLLLYIALHNLKKLNLARYVQRCWALPENWAGALILVLSGEARAAAADQGASPTESASISGHSFFAHASSEDSELLLLLLRKAPKQVRALVNLRVEDLTRVTGKDFLPTERKAPESSAVLLKQLKRAFRPYFLKRMNSSLRRRLFGWKKGRQG